MKHMYICRIAGFCIWPRTSQDRFIMDWTEFQRALRRCHSVNPLYDNLWVCVYAGRFWLCVLFRWSLNNVSMQQRSEAIPDTSLPLTKHQQNFILSLSLSPALPPILFRWLAVFTWWSSLALGTGGRGIREGGGGGRERWSWEKREKQTVTLVTEMGKWSNELAVVCMCVYLCQTCVCVCVCVWVWGKVGVKQ